MFFVKKVSIIMFFLSFVSLNGIANTVNESHIKNDSTNYCLTMTKRNRSQVFAVHAGDKITVWAKKLKFRGTIVAVTNDRIYINNFPPVYIKDITKIKLQTTVLKIVGIAIMAYGALYVVEGIVLGSVPGLFYPSAIIFGFGAAIVYLGYDVYKGKTLRFIKWSFRSEYLNNSNNTIQEDYFIDE